MNKYTKILKQVNNTHNCDANELYDMVFTSVPTTKAVKSNLEFVKPGDKHLPLKIEVSIQKPQVENNRSQNLENEIERLRKNFESFKIAHDEEIKALRSEIRILRGI